MNLRTAVWALFVAIPATSVPAAELPVRQVVLYKHGVGYFERSGTIPPGETARLDFTAEEMNDVLKSLSITEKGGAKVSALRYDSSIPLDEKLAHFPFHIENGQPLSALLDQLRGARLELRLGAESVTGIVVGARLLPAAPPAAAREQITLLTDTGDLKSYDLAAASSLRFADPTLQSQFRDYLTAVAGSRSVEKRSLLIDSTGGTGPRSVTATYIVPSPVWKSSYRLLLGTASPILEGWAIVDNTTGEDWNSVSMSLVSGKPISFLTELYQPKYVARQTAQLPDEEALAPRLYQSALARAGAPAALASPAPPPPPGLNGVFGGIAGGVPGGMGGPAPKREQIPSTVSLQTTAQERGDLFEYSISSPVTIRKNESAMLPFLQDKIEARRLVVYSDAFTLHPLQAAELKNTTGKTLDGGPITVFDANTYAGEALVATLKDKEKRIVSYGLDLGSTVTTAYQSKGVIVRKIRIVNGTLIQTLAAEEVKSYQASNADAKAKTLIIEHAKRPGFELLSPQPSETTPAGYRFEVALPAKGAARVDVSEQRIFDETRVISNLNDGQITFFLQNKALGESSRRALVAILATKNKISDLDRQIAAAAAEIEGVNNDARRLRENIATLNGVSGQQNQVQTYATRLASLENNIAAATQQLTALKQQRATAQTSLDSQLTALSTDE